MANHKSASKRARQDENRRQRNRWWRARLRSTIKEYREAIEAGDKEKVGGLLATTLGLVDRTSRAGVLPSKTASRYKSRLQLAANKLG